MLRISNVKVALGKDDYRKAISQELNVREKYIQHVQLDKLSIDARRGKVHFICSFLFEVENEEEFLKKHLRVQKYKPYHYTYPKKDNQKVVIVGSGPAGLFCGYVLSKIGQDVTIVERGQQVEKRIEAVDEMMKTGKINPQSNISFGEGGAGTFSDGKLTTGIKNHRLRYILETFVHHGAPEDILYLSKPHIGTDYLRKVLISMREEMIKCGAKFMFETQFIDFYKQNGMTKVVVKNQDYIQELDADALVLAIGHSARDTYEMLYHKNMLMEQKAFAVGVRIEQLQETINRIQYKQSTTSPYLKAAPYKLAVQTKERGVYTFCMCPGGEVVASSSEEGYLCVNGMSYYKRDGKNANSAILVNVKTEDFSSNHPLAGIEFQRELEKKAFELGGGNGYAPVQLVYDYYENRITEKLGAILPTYKPGYTLANLNEIFPEFINRNLKEGLQLMNEKMPGFIDENTIITGVEARSSAPVRMIRNSEFQSSIENIYPIGEGAGYAGGIMSAAVDGIMCAEAILKGDYHGSKSVSC